MNTMLLMISAIILLCIILNIISGKIGVPVLLAFILLGMAFGSDGFFKIKFDDFEQADDMLICIDFYNVLRRLRNQYKRGQAYCIKGGTAFKHRCAFDFGICSIIQLLCFKVFMDKQYADRCRYLIYRCRKCFFNTS